MAGTGVSIVALSVLACAAAVVLGPGILIPLFIVLVAAAAVVRPALGLIAFAFLAPFDGYQPALRIYKDLLWSDLLMLAVLATIMCRDGVGRPRSLAHAVAIVAVVALGVLQMWSLVVAPNWVEGLDNLLRYGYYAAFLIVVAGIVDTRIAYAMMAALVAGTACRFVYEAIPYFSDAFVLHPSYQFGVWTSNPNTLAGRAAAVVAFGVAWVVSGPRGPVRVAAVAATAVIAAGLLLSFSKGAWVAAAAALVVWSALSAPSIGTRRMAAAATVALMAALMVPQVRVASRLVIERWTSAASTISNQERLRYLGAAWQMTLEHPLGGVGLEQFPGEYRKLAQLSAGGPEDAHNAYLHMTSELGVPALGAFLLLLGAWLAAGMRGCLESAGKAVPAAIVASVVAIGVLQLFSSEPWNWRGFWLLALLPWTYDRPLRQPAVARAGLS